MAHLAAAAACVLAALGCATEQPQVQDRGAPSPLPCKSGASPLTDHAAMLRDFGTMPRTPLRYTPQPGHAVHNTVTQKVTISAAEQTSTVQARVDYTVTVRSRCGDAFTMDTVYDTPQVSAAGPEGASLGERINLLAGLTVRESRDTRGRVIATSRSAPGAADATNQQALDQVLGQLAQSSSVFPEQPVGTGAQWTLEQSQTIAGLALVSRADYTLLERTADQATLALGLVLTADPQTASVDGQPVTLEAYHGTGEGTLRVDLSGAAPATGQIDVTVQQRLRVGDQVADQTVSQAVTVTPSDGT